MEMTISQAQNDMRYGYYSGGTGILASALAWFIAALTTALVSIQAGIWALLIGGVLIYPVSLIICKLLRVRGCHTKGNPFGLLAGASTFWLIFAIIIAFVLSLSHPYWFFPAMLLTIGGRYLVFATIYGMRLYWVLGLLLAGVGMVLAVAGIASAICAFSGAAVEATFSVLCMYRHAQWIQANNISKRVFDNIE